ncbi:hypothetical protein ACFX13_039489 [Malus domestica]
MREMGGFAYGGGRWDRESDFSDLPILTFTRKLCISKSLRRRSRPASDSPVPQEWLETKRYTLWLRSPLTMIARTAASSSMASPVDMDDEISAQSLTQIASLHLHRSPSAAQLVVGNENCTVILLQPWPPKDDIHTHFKSNRWKLPTHLLEGELLKAEADLIRKN